ncbi:hypothetical protein CYMTET_18375 [Cymbomonas tetramitiformis]|uniref:Uncharacterized protein n=1 Tax=Cymbomonas tetramitiformis TaxID=36881 RepID=A0AAE0G9J4_9CHLO|nr:hypothetical protein CYMTET_18375 [Cymbomonas tetramitiformis]
MSLFIIVCAFRAPFLLKVVRRELDVSQKRVLRIQRAFNSAYKSVHNTQEVEEGKLLTVVLKTLHGDAFYAQYGKAVISSGLSSLSDGMDIFEVVVEASMSISVARAKDHILTEFHKTVQGILYLPYVLVEYVLFSPASFVLDAGYFNDSGGCRADSKVLAVSYQCALVFFPLFIFWSATTTHEEEYSVYIVNATVLIFLFFLELPIIYICVVCLPYEPQSTTIQDPSTKVRRTLQNMNAVVSVLLEAYTLNSLCFQLSTQQPDNVKVAFEVGLFNFGTVLWQLTVVGCICIAFTYALLTGILSNNRGVFCAPGLFAQTITSSLPLFTGPFFMVTVSTLLAVLDCTSLEDESGTRRYFLDSSLTYKGLDPVLSESHNSIECYVEGHRGYAFVALLAAVLFFPSATLSPYGSLPEFTHPNLDIKTVPLFTIIERLIKVNITVFATLFSNFPNVFLPIVLVGNLALLISNEMFAPCCIPQINALKSLLYVFSLWTVLVTWTAELAKGLSIFDGRLDELRWVSFLLVLFGFIFILTGGQRSQIIKRLRDKKKGPQSDATLLASQGSALREELRECLYELNMCKKQLYLQSLPRAHNIGGGAVSGSASASQDYPLIDQQLVDRVKYSAIRTRIYIERTLYILGKYYAYLSTSGAGSTVGNVEVARLLNEVVLLHAVEETSTSAASSKDFSMQEEVVSSSTKLFGLKLLQASFLWHLTDGLLEADLMVARVDASGSLLGLGCATACTALTASTLKALLLRNTLRHSKSDRMGELKELGVTYDQRILLHDNQEIMKRLVCSLDFSAAAEDGSNRCQATCLALDCLEMILEGPDSTELLTEFVACNIVDLLVVFLAPPKVVYRYGRRVCAPATRSAIRQGYEQRVLHILNLLRRHDPETMERLLISLNVVKTKGGLLLPQVLAHMRMFYTEVEDTGDEEASQDMSPISQLYRPWQLMMDKLSGWISSTSMNLQKFLISQGIEGLSVQELTADMDEMDNEHHLTRASHSNCKLRPWQVLGTLERLVLLNKDCIDELLPVETLRVLMPTLVSLAMKGPVKSKHAPKPIKVQVHENYQKASDVDRAASGTAALVPEPGGDGVQEAPADGVQEAPVDGEGNGGSTTVHDTGLDGDAGAGVAGRAGHTATQGPAQEDGAPVIEAGMEVILAGSREELPGIDGEAAPEPVAVEEDDLSEYVEDSLFWEWEAAVACLRSAVEMSRQCALHLLRLLDRDQDEFGDGIKPEAAARALYMILQEDANAARESSEKGCELRPLGQRLQDVKGLERLHGVLLSMHDGDGHESELQLYTSRCITLMAMQPEHRKRIYSLGITRTLQSHLLEGSYDQKNTSIQMLWELTSADDVLVDDLLTPSMVKAVCETIKNYPKMHDTCFQILSVWVRRDKMCAQLKNTKEALCDVLRSVFPLYRKLPEAREILRILSDSIVSKGSKVGELLDFYFTHHLRKPDCYDAETNSMNVDFDMTDMDWRVIMATICFHKLQVFKIDLKKQMSQATIHALASVLAQEASEDLGPESIIFYAEQGTVDREMPAWQLRRGCGLSRLEWQGRGFRSFEGMLLAGYLNYQLNLVELDLSNNQLGDIGCLHLVETFVISGAYVVPETYAIPEAFAIS